MNISCYKIHKCEKLLEENKTIPEELSSRDMSMDTDVDIVFDGIRWNIAVPYMNKEKKQIDKAYRTIWSCPYCGVGL